MTQANRRSFLKASAFAAPFARALGANDDVRLAIVGVGSSVKIGGKGKQEIRAFQKVPGVRIVALCDVDRAHLDPEVQKFKDRNEPIAAYTDVRRLLESKEIDAVVVTTPNHWHALVTVWACQAGKDVYVQKPASHTIFEGRRMAQAMKKYNRIVASPHGMRGSASIGEAFDYARKGNLGKVLYVHGINYKPRPTIGKVAGPQPIPQTLDYDLWSGPAPVAPLQREFLHYDWHWDWRYGNGELGNMGIHYMDGCRMAVGQKNLPERVLSIGGRFGYDDDGRTPNTQIAFLDYKPVPIIFEVRGLPKDRAELAKTNGRWAMDAFRGIQLGVVIHCENGYVANNQAFDKEGKLIRKFGTDKEGLELNFIQAVRSRKVGDLHADALDGHLSAALVHMTNISHRIGKQTSPGQIKETIRGDKNLTEAFGRLVTHLDANGIDLQKRQPTLGAWLRMDPQTEKFVGPFSERANQLATREYRAPFIVPREI